MVAVPYRAHIGTVVVVRGSVCGVVHHRSRFEDVSAIVNTEAHHFVELPVGVGRFQSIVIRAKKAGGGSGGGTGARSSAGSSLSFDAVKSRLRIGLIFIETVPTTSDRTARCLRFRKSLKVIRALRNRRGSCFEPSEGKKKRRGQTHDCKSLVHFNARWCREYKERRRG